MRNFIFRVGNKLYKDFLAYYAFKLIIINLNVLYFGSLAALNILFWYNTRCDCLPKTDPNIHYTPNLFIFLNVCFTLYLCIHLIVNLVSFSDRDNPLFETYLYKQYFSEIESKY